MDPSKTIDATSQLPFDAVAPRDSRTIELLPGARVARFEVVRELGRGGFGVVYEARDTELGRRVALKVLRPESAHHLERLKTEAAAVARLNHEQIVTLFDYGEIAGEAGLAYLVFELCPGETLEARLVREGTLPAAVALEIAIQVTRGLAHAHRAGVIHCDLKPSNVILGEGGTAKILDFGLARLRGEAGGGRPGRDNLIAGTPAYMAPEQWLALPRDERTDVWSMGVLLHRMISGELPFRVTTAGSEALEGIPARGLPGPDALARLVEKALAREPKGRQRDGGVLLDELLAASSALGPSAATGLRRGDRLDGRFKVEHLVTLEDDVAVFLARDERGGAGVKLQVWPRDHDGASRARLADDARALVELEHPGVARHLAHGSTPVGEPYLVSEWLEGEDLAARLARGPLATREALALCEKVAAALGAAHARGIVHRGVAPGAVLLVGGALEQPKLTGFDPTRVDRVSSLAQGGRRRGAAACKAPEQVRGGQEIDARADVFALGCVLFHCLTGRPPFAGDDDVALCIRIVVEEAPPAGDFCPTVPAAIEAFLARLLRKDRRQRPADGDAVSAGCAELLRLLAESPTEPRGPRTGPTLTTSEQRVVSVVLVGPPATGLPGATSFLAAVVRAHGGQLEPLADGALVVTLSAAPGRRTSATDLAAQAARCALALRAAVDDVAIVLATGRGMLAGDRLLGDVIDRAVGLLRSAGGARAIILDDVSASLLGARFDVAIERGLPAIRGERDAPQVARTLLGQPTPCVGRERELAGLEAILAECAAEPVARAMLITAPPGQGKSRLRHELLLRLDARSERIQIWIARADPMSSGAPFALLAPLIRRVAGVLDGEPAVLQQRKLRARLGRHLEGEVLQRVSEFLGEVCGIPFPDADSVQLRAARLDQVLMGDQMLRAWQDFVAAECGDHPLLLVLEDLHWGDLPTVKFVEAALRNLHDRPLMVLALARPEVHEQFPGLWAAQNVSEIRLSALSRRASERLVRAVLPRGSGELVARLCDLAGGNAFYLEELIRTVAEGHGEPGANLPETILAMMQSRLAALAPGARRLLRAASVFGEVFRRSGVAALCGNERTERLTVFLDDLCAAELIQRRVERSSLGGEEHVFRHALVREAAYATLTEKDRVLGHRLAAEWLQQQGDSPAAVIAEHLERGGEVAAAVGWYRRAAEQALAGDDLAGALATVSRAVSCGATGEVLGALLLLRAEVHGWRGELSDAEGAATAALELLPRGGASWWRAAGELAVACGGLARYDRLTGLVDEVRGAGTAGEGAERARIVAVARAGAMLFSSGRYALANAILDEIDDVAEVLVPGDPALAGALSWARGWRANFRRDLGGALALRADAAASYEQAGDLRSACQQRAMQGSVYNKVGCFAEAEEVLRRARVEARRMAIANVVALVDNNLGFSLCSLGLLDEGLAVETDAALAYHERQHPRMESASRAYLARFLVAAGRLEEAEREARAAIALAATTPPSLVHAQAMLAHVLLALRRPDEALAAARQAHQLLATLGGANEGESLARLTLAQALQACGHTDAARAAAAEARDLLLARAAPLRDPRLHASFLENVEDNARTIALARELSLAGG